MPKLKVSSDLSNKSLTQSLAQPLSLEAPTSLVNQNVVNNQLTQMQPNVNIQSNPNSIFNVNDKNKGKKQSKEYDFNSELSQLGNKPMYYDNNQTSAQLVKKVSTNTGISPKLLYSSSWIEGMNKAVADPDSVSEAYNMAISKGVNLDDFPVDGFHNYGLDTFGNNYDKLKKYLPKGFENRFKGFEGINEKGEKIQTAAFKTNEDALTAKAAFLKLEKDNIESYAKKSGIDLDEDAKDYFTMASYNSGFGNAKKMLEEYSKAKDKKSYIEKGETSFKQVDRNVRKRRNIMGTATKLLGS